MNCLEGWIKWLCKSYAEQFPTPFLSLNLTSSPSIQHASTIKFTLVSCSYCCWRNRKCLRLLSPFVFLCSVILSFLHLFTRQDTTESSTPLSVIAACTVHHSGLLHFSLSSHPFNHPSAQLFDKSN